MTDQGWQALELIPFLFMTEARNTEMEDKTNSLNFITSWLNIRYELVERVGRYPYKYLISVRGMY